MQGRVADREQTTKALLDTPADAAILLDTKGIILGSNEIAARELHKRTDELIGLSIWELVPDEAARLKRAFVEEAIRSHKPMRFEDESQGTHNDNIVYPVLNAQGEVAKVALLSRDITKRKQLEARLWKQTHDLGKRVRELTCLYGISDLVQRTDLSVGEILQRTADLIPSGWQYPDVACARIVLDSQEFPTCNFREAAWKQASPIVVQGRCVGSIEVCYLEERPRKEEGPFLKEERDLINAIAERLGAVIERQRAQEALRASYRFLEIANRHTKLPALLREFASEARNFTECAAVGIRMADREGNIPDQAQEAFHREFFGSETPLPFKTDQCVCANVIAGTANPGPPLFTQEGSFHVNSMTRCLCSASEEQKGQVCGACSRLGYESVAIIPIRLDGRVLGLIHVADRRENMISPQMVELLEGAAMQLGAAVRRVRAEQNLRESEEEYRTLFENSPEAISVTQGGKFVDVNPAWLALHGLGEKEDVIGMDALDIIHPDDRKVLLERRNMSAEERNRGYEIRDVRKNGKAVEVEVYSSGIALGGEAAILTTVRDVSERRRLQSELIQSAKMAAVGTMISGIAHELNNPLAAITGYAHLLSEDRTIPDASREDIRRILSQSERCAHVVENLLRFARRESAEKKRTDLNEVLANTVDLRRYEMRVTDVLVNEEYAPNLPEAFVNAHQLQQVFLNIVSNAFDAIQERKGKGAIVVRTRRDVDGIAIEIEDDGGGIEDINRIFEPFFTTKKIGKGTGLGLSVAYGIVQEHGGSIRAENTAEGARFTIRLPVGDEADAERQELEEVVAALPSTGKRILVVDDEEDVAETVCCILANLGYEVETSYAVESALQRLKTETFDVVISDLIMPGKMTVKDLYAWIRDHLPRLAQHMIFMTGSATGQRTNDLVAAIGCPVIPKPFEIEKLYQVVNGVAAQA